MTRAWADERNGVIRGVKEDASKPLAGWLAAEDKAPLCRRHASRLIAKFRYTDTDTDTDFFAAKLRWVRAGPFRRKKVRVRVRVGPVPVSV